MKKKIKSALFVTLTLALVSAAAVAITWAAATTKSMDAVTNTMSGATPGVQLAEPLWNSYDYDHALDDPAPTTGSSITIPGTSPAVTKSYSELGENMAKSYTPGDTEIPKNPSLKNSSSDTDEWLAMEINYQLKPGVTVYTATADQTTIDGSASDKAIPVSQAASYSASTVLSYATKTDFENALVNFVGWDATNWETITVPATAPGELYIYKTNQIAAGATTSELFTAVKIPDKTLVHVSVDGAPAVQMIPICVDNAKISGTAVDVHTVGGNKYIYVQVYPEFDIKMKGYAVQYDANNISTAAKAKDELLALYKKEHSLS